VWSIRENIVAAAAATDKRAGWAAWGLLVLSMLVYIFGRVQSVILLEVGSLIPALAASVALVYGWPAVKAMRFPLFFLLFLVPLPGFVIDSLTSPLKLWVSEWAEFVLTALNYPVGRSGVTLSVGQYQLLVAEACAGLQTMFALEAFGLLYTNLQNYRTWQRATLMAVLVVPVAFLANVVRTATLVLITYRYGDEVGQGFVHGFAGILLFVVALVFIHTLDRALERALPAAWK
jgi:exosortase B